MGELIDYIWQSTFCLLFFFGIYWVFLRGEKAFHFTRGYLLITPLLALLFPKIEIPVGFNKPTISLENTAFYQSFLYTNESEEIVGTFRLPEITVSSTKLPVLWEFTDYLLLAYIGMALLLLGHLIWQMFQLRQLIEKGWYQAVYKLDGNYFLIPTYGLAPIFAYFNKLFWDDTEPLNEIEKAHVLQHELEHIKQKHSWDVMYYQALSIIFWFNPAIHLMRSALVDLHEYLADESVLKKTENKESYPKLIIKIAFKGLDLPVGNYFIRSTTLKRIMMMKKHAKINWGKLLMVIPLTGMLMVLVSMKTMAPIELFGNQSDIHATTLREKLLLAQDSIDVSMKVRKIKHPQHYEYIGPLKNGNLIVQLGDLEYIFGNIDSDQEYLKLRGLIETLRKDASTEISYRKRDFQENIEVLPTPLDGEESWFGFFMSKIKKPQLENSLGIGGRVEIEFTVDEKGRILDPMIRKSFGGGLDESLIAALMSPEAPQWKPGEKNGKPVPALAGIRLDFTETATMAGAYRNIYPLLPGSKQLITVDQSGRPSDVFDVVESMPIPPGGMEGWNAFLKENLRYPEKAKEMGIEGTVYVTFVVEKSGEISEVGVLRGIGGGADEEAMRVVENSPKWTPGKQRGREVNVIMRLPIRFQVPTEEKGHNTETIQSWKRIASSADGKIEPGEEFYNHLRRNLKFPNEARETETTGTVLVKLDFNQDGSIKQYKIISGVSPEMDQEVLRNLETAPKWERPSGGKEISDLLAVTFKLSGSPNLNLIQDVSRHEVVVVAYGAQNEKESEMRDPSKAPLKLNPKTDISGYIKKIDSPQTEPYLKMDEDSLKGSKKELNNIKDRNESLAFKRIASASDEEIPVFNARGTRLGFQTDAEYVAKPLFVLDGKVVMEWDLNTIDPKSIDSITVLKGPEALVKYPEKGKNGVVEIYTKK